MKTEIHPTTEAAVVTCDVWHQMESAGAPAT
jgi:ribosomal protein L31